MIQPSVGGEQFMKKVIEKGKVYKGRYFSSLACMALEDSHDEDDFILITDLETGKESNIYAHQLELMQEDYAREYIQSEMIWKYPNWNEIVQSHMTQHIFTFGVGHPFWNRYVVIQSSSAEQARQSMFDIFGNEWSMQYTEKEFSKAKSEGFFLNLDPLPTIKVR